MTGKPFVDEFPLIFNLVVELLMLSFKGRYQRIQSTHDQLYPPWTVACQALCAWNFQDKNTEVGCHVLLQGIFLIQGWNRGLPHCRQILYRLSHITYLAIRDSSLEDSESWPEEKNTIQLQEVWKDRERDYSQAWSNLK